MISCDHDAEPNLYTMNRLKKITLIVLIAITGYLAVGYLLHLVVFPEKKSEISDYFHKRHEFKSEAEGFYQEVVAQQDGLVYCNLVVSPFAPGPPKHIHTGFDEYFEVQNGELSVWVDGDIKRVKPGEVVHIPKGTPHQPFNETADTIYLKESFAMPEKFAFHLSQIYGLMDHHPNFGQMPAMVFMLAPLHVAGFDSFLYEGPPVFIQKLSSYLMTPIARLMGYKSYYEQYDVRRKDGTGGR